MYCTQCGAQNPDTARYCCSCGAVMSLNSAVPPSVTPQYPIPALIVQPYAGFWRRVVAYLIDSIILFIPGRILERLSGYHDFSGQNPMELFGNGEYWSHLATYCALSLALWWLYYALFESSKLQATPGKLALGIQVTDTNGRRITFGRATGREFGKFLSALIFCIGFMMAGITEKKQALHDMMAGTLVVKKP